MQDKNLELMEKAPIPKAILSLALPTVVSSIVILIYNFADTYFIGMSFKKNDENVKGGSLIWRK